MNNLTRSSLRILLLISFSGLSMAIFASPATEKSVNTLLELTNISHVLDQTTTDMQPLFDQKAEDLIRQLTNSQTFSIDEQNVALQISALLSQTHQQIINNPKYKKLFHDIYKDTYSEEELQAYIAFLNTPLGQSINQKSNKLISEIFTQTTEFSEKTMATPEFQKVFEEKLATILQPLVAD